MCDIESPTHGIVDSGKTSLPDGLICFSACNQNQILWICPIISYFSSDKPFIDFQFL